MARFRYNRSLNYRVQFLKCSWIQSQQVTFHWRCRFTTGWYRTYQSCRNYWGAKKSLIMSLEKRPSWIRGEGDKTDLLFLKLNRPSLPWPKRKVCNINIKKALITYVVISDKSFLDSVMVNHGCSDCVVGSPQMSPTLRNTAFWKYRL